MGNVHEKDSINFKQFNEDKLVKNAVLSRYDG